MSNPTPESNAYRQVLDRARARVEERLRRLVEEGESDCRLDCEHYPPRNVSEPAEDILGSKPIGDGSLEIQAVEASAAGDPPS